MLGRLANAAAGMALSAAVMVTGQSAEAKGPPIDWSTMDLTAIDGTPFDAAGLSGKVVLLVNTASRCAFTPQYKGLEALWDRYADVGLTVLAIPSNDFGGQEPGSNEAIAEFCSARYDVSFPMLGKSPVTGAAAHPLFVWARETGGRAGVPAWNFHKILIGRDGRFRDGYPSFLAPDARKVVDGIEAALRTPAF